MIRDGPDRAGLELANALAVTFVAGDGERAPGGVTPQEYAQHILDEETDR